MSGRSRERGPRAGDARRVAEQRDREPDGTRAVSDPDRAREDSFRRSDLYTDPVVRGREVRDSPWRRLGAMVKSITISEGERREAALSARLAEAPTVTRTNTVAVVSPKGGVGKTTCTFLLGNLFAAQLRLRVLAVDANRDFGTLAALAPDRVRVDRSMADLLADSKRVSSAAELLPYVSSMPSGLHLLAAPSRPEVMAEMTPGLYGDLMAFLSRYYDVILLDLGTGIIDPLAQFGIRNADQTLLITSPEYVTAHKVLDSLRYLKAESEGEGEAPDAGHITVVLNRAPPGRSGDRGAIEEAFRSLGVAQHVVIPFDERLRVMLDSATYSLEALPRATRLPIKALGASVASKLV